MILFYTELWFSEKELQRLNLLVSLFLDFAEFQALEERPMRMADWIAALDNQILALQRKLLEGKGSVSHRAAIEKAEREFMNYRRREIERLESDFDKMVKQLPKREKIPNKRNDTRDFVFECRCFFGERCENEKKDVNQRFTSFVWRRERERNQPLLFRCITRL